MQPNIFALVIIDVDFDFLVEVQGHPLRRFDALQIGPHHVIPGADRHALRELALVIGVEVPVSFF